MALWNFLNKNKNNNQVAPIQMDADGNIDEQASMDLAQRTTPMTLADRLFGRTLTKDTIDVNNETGEGKLQTVSSYKPGLFNDITSGAKENFATGFAANNLRDNQLADGRQKGFGYRLGEGLGTIGRVLESPLGRGLLTAGIVGLTGGNGLEALAYGGQAGLLNQQLRKTDDLYRQQLKDNYGFSDDQLNRVKGYINNDTFNSLTKSQNSAMNLALKQQTTESMNKLRELQAEKLRIMNSTLPEEQKAKLIKLNAEAAHAEEMQLARINYYNNAAANPLGWANYGLRVDQYNDKKAADAQEAADKKEIVESLTGGGGMPQAKTPKGRAF